MIPTGTARRGRFTCEVCGSERMRAVAYTAGWMVSCSNGHEVFPMLGTILTTDVRTPPAPWPVPR